MAIKIHVTDPANIYHLDKNPKRTGWHNLYGNEEDALNGNIARVITTAIPLSLKSSEWQQDTDFCCGPSAIADALGMPNDYEPHNWLMQRGLMTSAHGTEYSGIRDYIRAKGYSASYDGVGYDGAMSGKCYNDILNCLRSGYKVIICVHAVRNTYWTNGGHYICLDGIRDDSNQIAEDGLWGQATTRRAQQVFGTTVDGIISNQNKKGKGQWENCQASSWDWVAASKLNRGSELIRAIQKKIGAKVDGFAGDETCRKLQAFLGVKVDGRFGPTSVKAFQTWLNKQS